MSSPDGAAETAHIIDMAQEVKPEPPRHLIRDMPPADPFPVDALGDVLGGATRAIHNRIQAPLAICGQSVLSTAALAVQAQADIELPTGQNRPISEYFVTVAATGERKSAADHEAARPIREHEAALREIYDADRLDYVNSKAAWDDARKAATGKANGDPSRIKAALDALGLEPRPPLIPMLTCPEPTYEGLCKLLAVGHPSVGIYATEGGQFIGGHGMSDEAKLRTAAGLSDAWDGVPIRRVRSLDGAMVLPGRRVAMHLMAQPDVAAMLVSDRLLMDQGLLSRVLVTAPEPASGTRLWHEPSADSDVALKRYSARLLDILEAPLPLAGGKSNQLAPRTLRLTADARRLWINFADHIERAISPGGDLEPVRGLANKLPEHAARLGAVLALVRDLRAGEVTANDLAAGIKLAQHYAAESLRLFWTGRVSADLHLAQRLLDWLLGSWRGPVVSLPDIYRLGPNAIRTQKTALTIVKILEDHGWLAAVPGGAEVAGERRREAWRIVGKSAK